jgi:hypothetical protein
MTKDQPIDVTRFLPVTMAERGRMTLEALMILETFDGTSKYLSDSNRFGAAIKYTRTSRIATDVGALIEPVHCIVGIDYHHFCRLANGVRRECGEEERTSKRAVTFGSRKAASRAGKCFEARFSNNLLYPVEKWRFPRM